MAITIKRNTTQKHTYQFHRLKAEDLVVPMMAGGDVGTDVEHTPQRTARLPGLGLHAMVSFADDQAAQTHVRDVLNSDKAVEIPYAFIHDQSLFTQSQLVKAGMAPWVIKTLAKDLSIDQTFLVERLGIPRSTFSRKLRENNRLSVNESERVLGIAKLIGQVTDMVNQSGEPKGFTAGVWVGRWLKQSVPALGNRTPLELMDTAAGQALVSQLLTQMQTGAYA